MDKTNVVDDQKILQTELPEAGGDVKPLESGVKVEEGKKGGQALQEKQEEDIFKEYEQSQSEDKGNQPSESDDLWDED